MTPRRAYRGWDHNAWTGKTPPAPEPQTERILPCPPADWFIDLDGYGIPCVWNPGDNPDRPEPVIVSRAVDPQAWAWLCRIFPDRRTQP